MQEKNYFIKGITEFLILSILNKNDSYVYEITKTIETSSGGLLSISQNTVYTATYKLLNEKKISEYTKLVGKKRSRVYYHLEAPGVFTLKELEKNYQQTSMGMKNILSYLSALREKKEEITS